MARSPLLAGKVFDPPAQALGALRSLERRQRPHELLNRQRLKPLADGERVKGGAKGLQVVGVHGALR